MKREKEGEGEGKHAVRMKERIGKLEKNVGGAGKGG